MSNRSNDRIAAALVIGVFSIGFAAQAQARTVDPVAPLACTASIPGDSLPVSPAPITVNAATTETLGDSVSASFPVESKIVVSNVAKAASPNALKLTLNTAAAAPGTWTLSVKGSKTACTGTVKVIAADKK